MKVGLQVKPHLAQGGNEYEALYNVQTYKKKAMKPIVHYLCCKKPE